MILLNLLLAFQLENYKNLRFLRFVYTHPRFWIQGSQRQTLEYTSKTKLILCLSILLIVLDVAGTVFFLSGVLLAISLISIFLLLPVYFVISHILITPLDSHLKKKIISQASSKLKNFPNLKIIGITGSMGKTTTKEILHTILKEKYNVLATEGTKNTPLGISRVILEELDTNHEIFIVEMGAYEKGNIAELCNITKPNISIITGITLQHLERFGSLDEIIDTKFEIIESLDSDDLAVLDTSTKGVQKGLKEKSFQTTNIKTIQKGAPFVYRENFGGIEFELEGNKISTKILSNYIVETLQICYEISKYLGMNFKEFESGVSKIDFVEHRMQLIHNTQSNIYIIDDSFNGNIEGVQSIIHLLKNSPFSGRKVVVAGGVVELGDESERVNSMLGKQIGEASDIVLLIDGPVGNAIESGLKQSGFTRENIKKYASAVALHEDLKNITQAGDLIVFQNDLPDQYL